MEYNILHTLEFDPIRKCMSIVVREKGQSDVILYSKGADSMIYARLRSDPLENNSSKEGSGFDTLSTSYPLRGSGQPIGGVLDTSNNPDSGGDDGCIFEGGSSETSGCGRRDLRDNSAHHLNCYAKLGLRTLCMAKRVRLQVTYMCVSFNVLCTTSLKPGSLYIQMQELTHMMLLNSLLLFECVSVQCPLSHTVNLSYTMCSSCAI